MRQLQDGLRALADAAQGRLQHTQGGVFHSPQEAFCVFRQYLVCAQESARAVQEAADVFFAASMGGYPEGTVAAASKLHERALQHAAYYTLLAAAAGKSADGYTMEHGSWARLTPEIPDALGGGECACECACGGRHEAGSDTHDCDGRCAAGGGGGACECACGGRHAAGSDTHDCGGRCAAGGDRGICGGQCVSVNCRKPCKGGRRA